MFGFTDAFFVESLLVTINLLPRTRSILVLILILRLTILSVVLRCTPLYLRSPATSELPIPIL
jgi:hypothetical protein